MKIRLISFLKRNITIKQIDLDEDHNSTITKFVFNYYNVDIDLLHSKSRKRSLVQSRHMICYLAYIFNDEDNKIVHPLKEFLKKDRTTILHSIKTMSNLIETNKTIANDYLILYNKIKMEIYD